MSDADPAPAVPPKANPDLASDAKLKARAAALVAALRNGNSKAQTKAAEEIALLVGAVDADAVPPLPENPRTTAALVAAGVSAALLTLILRANKVGTTAAGALNRVMLVSDAERRAVVDRLGVDKLLQLLQESQDKLQLDALVDTLFEFTFCSEWMESLSPDSNLVSRIFSLPFLSTANAFATKRALYAVERLLQRHPSFLRALAARTSLLVELLEHGSGAEPIALTEIACSLLHMLQAQDHFDALAFDEARVHVACVELLGQLLRCGESSGKPYAASARVLATSFRTSPPLRQSLHNLIFACPGALSGFTVGVGHACLESTADADELVSFLDGLRGLTPGSAASFLVDPQFAAVANFYHGVDSASHPAHVRLRRKLETAWKTPDCLRAMTRPLKHQKLAVAVSLACLSSAGVEFRRIIASNDHIEVLVQEMILLAGSPRLDTALEGDFAGWQEDCVRQSVVCLSNDLQLNDTAAESDDTVAAGSAAKRARTFSAAPLRASDVNVQRRDSTVLLIAGRPFYVNGALIEAKSAVLADALSDATTLDPVTIALPNEVPEEQHYGLFHVAVEHAYTGTIASDLAAESLLPLWCLGDHLQMDVLCAWCVERLVPVLAKDAALLESAWTVALARPSDALGDACATAWLLLEKSMPNCGHITAVLLLKRVHESCAAKELVAAQLVRVLRKALLAVIAKDDAAAAAAAAAADD